MELPTFFPVNFKFPTNFSKITVVSTANPKRASSYDPFNPFSIKWKAFILNLLIIIINDDRERG